MGLVHRGGQHTTHPARVGQGAQQDVGRAAPGRPASLEPVPLDLLTRRMGDLDGQASGDPVTGLAVGPQAVGPHRTHEGRVAARVVERDDLVIEGGEPEMRVVAEAGSQVRHERLDGVGCAAASGSGLAFPADIGADGLAVALEVTGDGRDRPAPLA